ncbi:ester cyclase [Halodesulfurarchaeum sp.]|uniref:ester cyclase n=1 Tax=Halodesulfurarchaeum sp. TaxID=1980530 RepID=UPI002FC3D6E5
MSGDETDTKAIVKEYLKAFNEQDYEALKKRAAEDMVEHGTEEVLEGIDEVVEYLQSYYEMFPDYAGQMDAIMAEDDLVTIRYTAQGTHTGSYKDIDPTGQYVEWPGMAMYRIEDDQIAEVWVEEDRLSLVEELKNFDISDYYFELGG